MEFFKSFKGLLTFSIPSWIGMVETFMAFVFCLLFALYCGGETEQEITGKNGAEYLVNFEINDGILNLIEKCDLKEVGDSCEVKLGVKVTMIVAPKEEVVVDVESDKNEAESETSEETPAETTESAEIPDKE
jgi:hypothetical protein